MNTVDLTDREKEIILAMAECDMNICAVGRKFYMCPSSVYYYVEIINKKTGFDLRRFYDLVRLLELVNE